MIHSINSELKNPKFEDQFNRQINSLFNKNLRKVIEISNKISSQFHIVIELSNTLKCYFAILSNTIKN